MSDHNIEKPTGPAGQDTVEWKPSDAELLRPLPERFSHSVESIRRDREALVVLLMGQDRYDAALEKLQIEPEILDSLDAQELMDYDDTFTDAHMQELYGESVSADPDIGLFERIHGGIGGVERAYLGEYSLPHNQSILSGPDEEYVDASGAKWVRYSEYHPSPSEILVFEHDFLKGDDYSAREKRVKEEAEVGVNGQPADPKVAVQLVEMLEQYQFALVALRSLPLEQVATHLGLMK